MIRSLLPSSRKRRTSAFTQGLTALRGGHSTTSHSLRFIDDNGAQGAGNGATVQLAVGGVEFLGHNLFSVEYATSGCTDGPWPANQASWVAYDNSL